MRVGKLATAKHEYWPVGKLTEPGKLEKPPGTPPTYVGKLLLFATKLDSNHKGEAMVGVFPVEFRDKDVQGHKKMRHNLVQTASKWDKSVLTKNEGRFERLD